MRAFGFSGHASIKREGERTLLTDRGADPRLRRRLRRPFVGDAELVALPSVAIDNPLAEFRQQGRQAADDGDILVAAAGQLRYGEADLGLRAAAARSHTRVTRI